MYVAQIWKFYKISDPRNGDNSLMAAQTSSSGVNKKVRARMG